MMRRPYRCQDISRCRVKYIGIKRLKIYTSSEMSLWGVGKEPHALMTLRSQTLSFARAEALLKLACANMVPDFTHPVVVQKDPDSPISGSRGFHRKPVGPS